MKSIFKYLLLLTAIFSLPMLQGCIDDEDADGGYPDFQDAVNMRIEVDPSFSSINADDPSSAKVLLDFYSQNIQDVRSIDLFVDFYDFSLDSVTVGRQLLRTIDPSDFQNGSLEGVEIPFEEFRNALGLQDSDFQGLDVVTIYNVTTLNDGRVYPQDIQLNNNTSINNVTPNIQNSTASTSFTSSIPVFVQCPLPDGFATGKYMIEQVSGPSDPFFGNPYRWAPGEVDVVAAGPIQRTFTASYFTFDVTFEFIVTCGVLVVNKTVTTIGCGGPTLAWTRAAVPTYMDDSEFTIEILDNVDGACGLPVDDPTTIKLTKL